VAEDAKSVTPSDNTPFADGPCLGLYVGGTGDVVAVTNGGTTVTFKAVPAGTFIPVSCSQVKSTNTTATSILALY
jgi:hypothetical protein